MAKFSERLASAPIPVIVEISATRLLSAHGTIVIEDLKDYLLDLPASGDDWLREFTTHKLYRIDEVAVAAFILASIYGPFVTAFCTELGKRSGGSAADWAARIRVRPRGKVGEKADQVELSLAGDGSAVVVILESELPDEARLALLDLDIKDPSFQGKSLGWDTESESWRPIER